MQGIDYENRAATLLPLIVSALVICSMGLWGSHVRDSACMPVQANGQQHLYCGCTVSAGGFANISISSARVRWTVVNNNRS
jgi:hypothetical protein